MQKLIIEGELTIFTAAERKTHFLDFLKSGNVLEIDLANVTEIDTAGLQLLMLIEREAAQAGKSLRFVTYSKAVLDALELANLVSLFGDPVTSVDNEG